MDTFNRIVTAITKYNDANDGQVNLASPFARADLAELVYNAVMKQNNDEPSYTVNKQDTFIFENKDPGMPK